VTAEESVREVTLAKWVVTGGSTAVHEKVNCTALRRDTEAEGDLT